MTVHSCETKCHASSYIYTKTGGQPARLSPSIAAASPATPRPGAPSVQRKRGMTKKPSRSKSALRCWSTASPSSPPPSAEAAGESAAVVAVAAVFLVSSTWSAPQLRLTSCSAAPAPTLRARSSLSQRPPSPARLSALAAAAAAPSPIHSAASLAAVFVVSPFANERRHLCNLVSSSIDSPPPPPLLGAVWSSIVSPEGFFAFAAARSASS